MSPIGRAFLGAILGALLTLAIHPASRPFISGASSRVSVESLLSTVEVSSSTLQPPTDLQGAGLWLELGFDRLLADRKLAQRELESLIDVADAAIESEGRNAFWHQARSVLLLQVGRHEDARESWLNASRASYWRDYQTERLQHAQDSLAERTGATQAWQYAFAYYARSDSAAVLIEQGARELLRDADYESEAGRSIRYATLVNGDLIRLGGKSISTAIRGANLIELSAYPAGMAGTLSPKRLWVGQNELLTAINSANETDHFTRAKRIFAENEGWLALINANPYEENAAELTRTAILVSEAPLALMFTSLVGILVWGSGVALQRLVGSREGFPINGVIVAILLLGTIVYLLSSNAAATFATALATAFLLVSPQHRRQVDSVELGPLFSFVSLVIASACLAALGGYIVSHSAPAVSLAPTLDLPQTFYGTPTLLGLAILCLSLVALIAPLWALFFRVGTPLVLVTGLRMTGAILAVGGLLLAVTLGPVCVYADRSLTETLDQLLSNEPVYYLVQ